MEALGTLISILILALIVYLVLPSTRRASRAQQGRVGAAPVGRPALQDRHAGVIEQFLQGMRPSDRWYYVENTVRECISEIAKKEGRSDLVPNYREWLPQWRARRDLPAEYLRLASYLEQTFGEQHAVLLRKKKEAEDRSERQKEGARQRECERFLGKNKDLLDKFLEIAERKVSVLDDYGDESWDALPKEVETCLRKMAQREGLEQEWLRWQKERKKWGEWYLTRQDNAEKYLRLEKELPRSHFKTLRKTIMRQAI